MGDIEILIDHFIVKHNARNNKSIERVPKDAYEILKGIPWKGNVRELENIIERAVVLAPGNELLVEYLLLDEESAGGGERPKGQSDALESLVGTTVHEMERKLIMSTLNSVSENRTRAAQMLGISIRTLRNKLKEYEI